MEVTDRIASLEQRVQMQEDEIQLLKSALADVVRRLNVSEEQQNAVGSRRGPTKARPMIATLPLRPSVNNGALLPKKGGGTLPSPSGSGSRKDLGTAACKRFLYLPLSTVRRANSNEHVGTLSRKDSGDSKGNRTRAGSTGSNSSGKKSDGKQRDPVFNAVAVTIATTQRCPHSRFEPTPAAPVLLSLQLSESLCRCSCYMCSAVVDSYYDAFTKCDTINSRYICLTYPTNFLHPLRFLLLRPACPRSALHQPPPLLSITGSSALLPPVYVLVTVQIYLSRSAKRKGTSGGPAAAASVTARSATGPQPTSDSSKAGGARKEEGYVKMFLKGRPVTMHMPKDQVDRYCLEARADLPGNKLKLDWVYPFLSFN
ncbi:Echinoderm microtubule-associated protein-like 1 [Liparis tanakae]|uniref:Echinoderm microtubule-associated protein-like 1 n=1 Tax=Liparis tanakae TaxID=230148 RepID=A0A4Z2J1Z6_9TELE|nr:Echinoderm microtubule-associated protein-like 1 [Liparis tanakae]